MSNVKVPRSAVTAVLKQTGKHVRPSAESRLTKEFNIINESLAGTCWSFIATISAYLFASSAVNLTKKCSLYTGKFKIS